MLHPHTELRFVSKEIGYGIFATEDIPLGTMTWVKDDLDRTISKNDLNNFNQANLDNLLKYTYRDKNGDYFFCWDLTRYVNHSFDPNSMLTSLGFEIAIKDIKKGDQITNDYGSFNIIAPFKGAEESSEREFVWPDDLTRYYAEWDKLIEYAMKNYAVVKQPLKRFLKDNQEETLKKVLKGKMELPSVLANYYDPARDV